ncbi:hypothetical protein P8935_12495 [Telmatobacter sp. DSM 110680]|uniref:Uncharacterized protein n=1 Tax=Telmatobacter sp. DSM 110680 TaxID=3036704 RepID=A0AAU7DCI6_9BACT
MVAAFLFVFGGHFLQLFFGAGRIFAEMECMAVAAVIGLVAALLKGAADRVEDPHFNETVVLALGNVQDAHPPKEPSQQ